MSEQVPEGLLVIDKPVGLTSHDVVARLRRVLGTRKVGHAGTLDPMATGVLVCGAGRATRLLGMVALHDKEYLATVRLGITTHSDDATGEMVDARGAVVDDAAIEAVLAPMRGAVRQRPSSVSAIKVDGRRAYHRVRSGEDVTLPEREVEITRLEAGPVRHLTVDGIDVTDVDITVVCSSGTYIRAIARDAGEALGVGGHLTSLRRTRVGRYVVDTSQSLEALLADPPAPPHIIGLADAAIDEFGSVVLDDESAAAVAHGVRISVPVADCGPVTLVDSFGRLLAITDVVDGRASYRMVLTEPLARSGTV